MGLKVPKFTFLVTDLSLLSAGEQSLQGLRDTDLGYLMHIWKLEQNIRLREKSVIMCHKLDCDFLPRPGVRSHTAGVTSHSQYCAFEFKTWQQISTHLIATEYDLITQLQIMKHICKFRLLNGHASVFASCVKT